METYKNGVVIWLVFQLIVIGLASGASFREFQTNGCIEKVRGNTEVTFASFWFPVVVPLAAFAPNFEPYYCE